MAIPEGNGAIYNVDDLPVNIIDNRAKNNHQRPFFILPLSKDPEDGYRNISYRQMSNAINRAAWWLEENLNAVDRAEPYAYFGPLDLRYIILMLGSVKAMRKILFPSPRNPMSGQLGLFESTGCKTVVYGMSIMRAIQPFISTHGSLVIIAAPDLEEFLDETLVPHYDYNESLETGGKQTLAIFHTSGSSGAPKPITWTQRAIMTSGLGKRLPPGNENRISDVSFGPGMTVLCTFPLFHAGGCVINFMPLHYDCTMTHPHPDIPMVTPDYLHKIVQSGVAQTYMLMPSILEDLFKVPTAASWLSTVSHVAYGGGPLSKPAGEYWASKLSHLFSFFGITETGWFHLASSSTSAQWDMIKPAVGIGLRFDGITENVFELVVENTGFRDQFTATFEVFPDLKEYRTKDLYAPSHEYDGWWRYLGRADDLIILSNGEKIDPVPMEAVIRSHTYVKGALMVGEFRFMPSLLVELDETRVPDGMTDEQTVEAIWPKIEEANRIAPRFAKISRALILITEVSFRRAGKGTVQRQLTIKDRAEDLNELYKNAEEGLLLDGLHLDDPSDSGSLKDTLKQIYEKALGASIEDDQDVFVLDMDSLQVTVVLQRIKATLKNSKAPFDSSKLTPQLVYSSPTINKISATIGALMNQNENSNKLDGNSSREPKIVQLIEKYSADFSNLPQAKSSGSTTQPWTIILTGTTGSLGSYLLSAFLSLPPTQIAKIFCLNRSSNSEKKQKWANTPRGLSTDWSSRAEFLHVDLSTPDFGLEPEKYSELLENTDAIVHNAWKVDFNVPLESFEAQIQGVANLLSLSAKSTKSAPLLFCSSIATALRWMNRHPAQRVPAAVLDDFDAPEAMGYAESKYVSERIIDNFTKATGIGSVVLRFGQIAGPTTDKGCWNRQEWFPSLVASSKYLALLPDSMGFMNNVDWIPVDLLANIVLELLGAKLKALKINEEKGNEGALVYNLVNPRVTPWGELLPVVKDVLGKGKGAGEIKVVSFNDWCEVLRKSVSENYGVATDKNPGVKLVDYFESMVGDGKMVEGALKGNGKGDELELQGAFEVVNLLDDSNQAKSLHAVGEEWMRLWLRQWDF